MKSNGFSGIRLIRRAPLAYNRGSLYRSRERWDWLVYGLFVALVALALFLVVPETVRLIQAWFR